MKKPVFILIILAFILSCCVPLSRASDAGGDDDIFVRALQSIADYSMPGIGIHDKSCLPYDHIRFDRKSNFIYNRGTYTSASKFASYIIYLLKAYEQKGYYAKITLPATEEEKALLNKEYGVRPDNKTISLFRLRRMLESVRACIDRETKTAPYLGGMVPWLSINHDGAVVRDKDAVPLLDNGLLSWSYAAVLGALKDDNMPLAQDVYKLTKELLGRQNYGLFIDKDNGLFYGEINAVTGKGNPGYELKRIWTEDMLSIVWGLFTTAIPEKDKMRIWDNTISPIVRWKMLNGDTIHAPKGYISSNHELIWTLLDVPFHKSALKDLIYNSQYLQADFALRRKSPGFESVAYNPLGSYMKMGIPNSSEFPGYVQPQNSAVVFGTAPIILVDKERGGMWLSALIRDNDLITPYGVLESVSCAGAADIISADSQYLIAASLGGGVSDDAEKYLRGNMVTGSSENYYDYMMKLFDTVYLRILKDNSLKKIRNSSLPIPLPSKMVCEYDSYRIPAQETEFEIMDNLSESGDDNHGSNVYAPGHNDKRWVVDKDGMFAAYSVPMELDRYSRFAWWGTYLGKKRPYIAAYTNIDVTVPNDGAEQKFVLYLKREDSSLIKPIPVNTRYKGSISADGKWKTYTFELKHRRRFINYPLTYVAFSISDPAANPVFPQSGAIRIKSLRLYNRDIKEGKIDVGAAIEKLKKQPFLNRPPRPFPLAGFKPVFIDSGAIGDATEDLTREEDGLLYLEFEDANLKYGASGIWTLCDDIDTGGYSYLVFDMMRGDMAASPKQIRIEFKCQNHNRENYLFLRNVSLKSCLLEPNCWYRVTVPLSKRTDKRKINIISFVYENCKEGIPSGSIMISSPVFVDNLDNT